MAEWSFHPYVPSLHEQRLVDMLAACEAHDHADQLSTLAELRAELGVPGFVPAADCRVALLPDGTVVGMAAQFLRAGEEFTALTWLRVHPAWRGRGLERDLLRWTEARAVERRAELPPGARLALGAGVPEPMDSLRAALEAEGYRVVRQFLEMARSLREPVPDLPAPPGVRLRPPRHPDDDEAWLAAHNDAFADHWDHAPYSLARWRYELSLPSYRPDLSVLAVTEAGAIVGYSQNEVRLEHNVRVGIPEGLIGNLGVRRPWRRQGLARALLSRGLQAMRAAGLEGAYLWVDATNPSGATRVYESVGFRERKRTYAYGRPLDPGR